MNCYITIVTLLQEERVGYIKEYMSHHAGMDDEDFDDDDSDASYTYTSETQGMTDCSSFVDDSSFWQCNDDDCCCANDDALPSEKEQNCTNNTTTMLFENLEMVGESSTS